MQVSIRTCHQDYLCDTSSRSSIAVRRRGAGMGCELTRDGHTDGQMDGQKWENNIALCMLVRTEER